MIKEILGLGHDDLHIKIDQRRNAQNNQEDHTCAHMVVVVEPEKVLVGGLDLLVVLEWGELLGFGERNRGNELIGVAGLRIGIGLSSEVDDVSQAVHD